MKLSEALDELVSGNPLLQLGINHQLFNLSQLARYLIPLTESRLKREVKPAALLMALSRYQREFGSKRGKLPKFELKKLSVNSGLVITTFPRTPQLRQPLNEFYRRVQRAGSLFTLSEGVTQVTVIYEKEQFKLRKKLLNFTPIREYQDVGSLTVRFEDRYLDTPGFLYIVLQQLYLQNLNILELSSTATELVIYLHEEDIRLAFDTLYRRFY